jgi:hypothetical protein
VRQIFSKGSTAKASAAKVSSASAETTSVMMARTLAVMKGASPAEAIAKYPGATPRPRELVSGPTSTTVNSGATPTAQPVGGTTGGTTYYSPEAEASGAGGLLLNYLLGN